MARKQSRSMAEGSVLAGVVACGRGRAPGAGGGESRPFVFSMRTRRIYIPDEELLEGLRRFVAAHEPPYTTVKFMAWPERHCTIKTLVRRFGSFRHALAEVGAVGGMMKRYSNEDLMALLETAWRRIGRPPGELLLRRYARISDEPYARRWGSLRKACAALARYHEGKITRRQLLNPNPASSLGRVSTALRWKILQRDGFRCQLCGVSARENKRLALHVDHIVPVSKGGMAEESNLRTLCAACNMGRGDGRERKRRRAA